MRKIAKRLAVPKIKGDYQVFIENDNYEKRMNYFEEQRMILKEKIHRKKREFVLVYLDYVKGFVNEELMLHKKREIQLEISAYRTKLKKLIYVESVYRKLFHYLTMKERS